MNNTMITCNYHLFNAYQLLQKGRVNQSIQQYQQAAKCTFNQNLKNNIKCTIAILQHNLGKDSNQDALHSVIMSQNQEQNSLTSIRIIINCILIDILQRKYSRAIQGFEILLEILQQESCLYQKKSLSQYICYLLFRVTSLDQIAQYIENIDITGLKLEEIYSISLMAFNSQLCRLQSQERVQRLCYEEYMKYKRYDLAIFCLRSLIKFTKNNLVNKQFYEKQLGKLIMLGYFNDSIDFQNYESYEVMQGIIQKFLNFRSKLIQQISKMQMKNILSDKSIKKTNQIPNKEIIIEWKYTIVGMMKQINKNKQMDIESKKNINNILLKARNQQNILIIRSMSKNNYFSKYYQKVHNIFISLEKPFNHVISTFKDGFNILKQFQKCLESRQIINIQYKPQKSRLSLKSERSRSALNKIKHKQKDKQAEKQNNPPLGISIVSIASSKITNKQSCGRKKIFEDSYLLNSNKKIQKMIKMCQHGSFLNKRNFNSEGGEYRFVKITNNFIKWGKDPQKIDTNCQIYPIKDIKSIIYGRVTPNLNENCNKMLNYSKCFSLLLQKRTLDFYCKNYEEIQGWVCGMSAVLKKHQVPIVGYTPGKLRWKKMFAILRQSFISPLKPHEKCKYYYENAYALILFAKNGYQLRKGQTK